MYSVIDLLPNPNPCKDPLGLTHSCRRDSSFPPPGEPLLLGPLSLVSLVGIETGMESLILGLSKALLLGLMISLTLLPTPPFWQFFHAAPPQKGYSMKNQKHYGDTGWEIAKLH